jgi:hypothetical protein
MSDDDFRDPPWTEQQWEEFMRKSDARSARFGELLETLRDHPDRDAIIAREMGWDRDPDRPPLDVPLPQEWSEADADEDPFFDSDGDDDIDAYLRGKRNSLEAMPAYAQGMEWGLHVHEALKDYGSPDGGLHTELDEEIGRALEGSMCVAAKIAGAHGMGYEDEVLCGNIVRCRLAADYARQGIDSLERLSAGGEVPAAVLEPLIEEGRRVLQLVEKHIAELRSRVWWE